MRIGTRKKDLYLSRSTNFWSLAGNRLLTQKICRTVIASALASFSFPAWSNGFFLPEQNATNLGTAYAGTASLAEDASTNYYNSAGLTRLCNEQIVAGGALALPHTVLDATSSTATNGASLGGGAARAHDNSLIPWLHYAKRFDDCWIFGASVVSPFGSKTDYDTNSIARYIATSSKLITVDFAPSIAYKFSDSFSLGAGVDAVWGEARLASQIGTGSVDFDGFTDSRGSRWGFGYHAGIMYEPTDCTRVGLNYHSRVKLKLQGQNLTQLAPGLPVASQGLKADIRLPDTATLSAYHAFGDCWAIMADAQWLHWKLYDQLILRYDDGTVATANQSWKDSYRLAIGGSYQFCPAIRLRAGASYDKTPTRSGTRSIFIPDEDQIGVGIGAQYRFDKCLAFDFGYAHIFADKATVHQAGPRIAGGPPNPPLQQNLFGSVKRRIDVLGLQATWDLM